MNNNIFVFSIRFYIKTL